MYQELLARKEEIRSRLIDTAKTNDISITSLSRLCGVARPTIERFVEGSDVRALTLHKILKFVEASVH